MKFTDIGYGNMIAGDRVLAIMSPESAPVKRTVQDAKDAGRVIDVSCGHKTKAVILTDSEHIILSALTPEKIAGRIAGDEEE